MNTPTHDTTKGLIFRDYIQSKKSLGDFALDTMDIYDDVCYELILENCTSKGQRVTGSAVMNTMQKICDFIRIYDIDGPYRILTVDTQKEFFYLLAEIRDDLKR